MTSLREIPGVQNPVMKHARATGWLAWKMRIEGRNGCPDMVFVKKGRVVWMEFKSSVGRLSVQQQLRIAELKAHGAEAYVVSDPGIGKAILDRDEGDLL